MNADEASLWRRAWRRWRGSPAPYKLLAATTFVLSAVVVEMIAQALLREFGSRWTLTGFLAAAGIVLLFADWFLGREQDRPAPDPPAARGEPLPPVVDLLGRDRLVDAVVAEARQHHVLLVHGPRGIGASAVAIEAARRLVPDPALQVYVDARGQHPHRPESARRVAVRVSSALGLPPGRSSDLAATAAALTQRLGGSGRVLVLDNVVRQEQVTWMPHQLHEAYLVMAGDPPARDQLDEVTAVRVGPLAPDAALRLLARQDTQGAPGERVADRLEADPVLALELARRYLKHPRVVLEMGRWLAANPRISVHDLLEDLGQRDPRASASVVRYILAEQLAGASPEARELLALLARIPIVELPEEALVALAGRPATSVSVCIGELVARSLLERTRPTRYRQPDIRPPAPAARDASAALVRLLRYYAGSAAANAEALSQPRRPQDAAEARRWFRTEDAASLQLLRLADPPPQAAAHLWRIADALEVWFASEDRPIDRRGAAQALLEAASGLGDVLVQQVACLRLAAIARLSGDLRNSARHLGQAARLQDRLGYDRVQPLFRAGQALHSVAIGELAAAHDHLTASHDLRPRGDHVGRAMDLANLGAVLLRQGELGAARNHLLQALDTARDDTEAQAHGQELLGLVEARSGSPARALAAWREARLRYEQLGDVAGTARCLTHAATVLLAAPDVTEEHRRQAQDMLHRSLALRRADGPGLGPALVHLALARSADLEGRHHDLRHEGQAGLLALGTAPGGPYEPEEVAVVRGRLTSLIAEARPPEAPSTGSTAPGRGAGQRGFFRPARGWWQGLGRWRRRSS